MKRNLKSKRSWSNLWSSFHFFRKAMNSENRAEPEKCERQFFLHCPTHRCDNKFLQTFSSINRSRGVSPGFGRLSLILRLLRPRTSLSSAVFSLDSDSVSSSTGPKARLGTAAAPSIAAIPLECHQLPSALAQSNGPQRRSNSGPLNVQLVSRTVFPLCASDFNLVY